MQLRAIMPCAREHITAAGNHEREMHGFPISIGISIGTSHDWLASHLESNRTNNITNTPMVLKTKTTAILEGQ